MVKFSNRQERINNLATINKLCTFAGVESSEGNLKHCMMTRFSDKKAKVSLLELKAFIWARCPDSIKVKKHLPGTKGDLQKAQSGEHNAILVAYNLREKPSPIHSNAMEDTEEEPTIETQVVQVVPPSYEVVNVLLDVTKVFVFFQQANQEPRVDSYTIQRVQSS